jgi:hypothetical protein
VRPEGLGKFKKITSSGIEPATSEDKYLEGSSRHPPEGSELATFCPKQELVSN